MNWISIVNLTSELMDDCSLQRSHSKWDNTGNRHSTLQQEMESIAHGNLCVALRTTKKTTTNKTKTTTNYCSGIMGKPSCSAVQLGRKDKPWMVWPEPLLSISTCFSPKTHSLLEFLFSYGPFNHYPDGRRKIWLFSEIPIYPPTLLAT
jgi:hypothetical protein